MSDAHRSQAGGGWEPIPQSEGYDGDATAFVQLPPEFMLEGTPLEAPGHGYVPPMIVPLTPLNPPPESADPSGAEASGVDPSGVDPAGGSPSGVSSGVHPSAGGVWPVAGEPAQGARAHEFPAHEFPAHDFPVHDFPAHEGPAHEASGHGASGHGASGHGVSGHGASGHGASGHGAFAHDASAHGASGHGVSGHGVSGHDVSAHEASGHGASAQEQTGQWTIPTVEGDAEALEDSGEYTASRLAQYAGSAPATLPGGAPAPWAVPEPGPEPEPVHEAEPEAAAVAPEREPEPELAPEPEHEPEPFAADLADPAPADFGPADQAAHADLAAPVDLAPADPATAAPAAPVDMSTDSDEHPHTSYTLRVNGADRPVTDSWIGESLLYVLRERLGLAGAKDGCSQGECGACNVQVDGRLVASCLVPAATAAGCEVRTVEGLAVNGEPSDVQRALAKCGVQCGFCIPGMAMTVHDLLEGNHAPTELETRQALCGNLCRCSGYRGVLDAVKEVVAGREAEAGDEPRIPHQIPHPFDGGTA
ncbi:(2Fe-2S)-binding protein [Streptomyces sp. NPDC053431]|uniref:(2Fe-2S)-binding protein n=1 Tax=Streptomyces sp. NPDC053431 TaxID=3365703 RepID=UPI0037CF5882